MCIEVKGSVYMEQSSLVDSYQLFRAIGSRGIVDGIATTLDKQEIGFWQEIFPSLKHPDHLSDSVPYTTGIQGCFSCSKAAAA